MDYSGGKPVGRAEWLFFPGLPERTESPVLLALSLILLPCLIRIEFLGYCTAL